MGSLYGLLKLLPQLLKFGKILLRKYEVQEAKDRIKQQNKEIEHFIERYDKDPADALSDFWNTDS